jgi:hypothetical protein
MSTRYLSFPTAAAAAAQSQADWAQKILGHPTLSTSATKALWGYIVNPNDGTALGVFADNVMTMLSPKLTPAELADLTAALLPATAPLVVATLAAIAAVTPH